MNCNTTHYRANSSSVPGDPTDGHEKIAVKIPLTHAEVELVGFWSDKHTGVFTHMGSNVHIHGRTADNKISGHLDEVKIGSGKLWLPAAN